jgi:tyrosyl-tRNA synthetase
LSREQIEANAETYKKQVFKVLDPEKTVIDFNSRWLGALSGEDWIRLTAKLTVAQILERDEFQQRMRQGITISLHELLYPVAQAYDSVALRADVELGGTDQKFNLLVGRDLQLKFGQEPQVIMTVPLLEGTDGVQKMSKSYGNYIGISEPPKEIFGKTMSISDELMWRYYELLTDVPPRELVGMRREVEAGRLHPRDVKAGLARRLVADFHSIEAAHQAEEEFDRMFRQKQNPDEVPTVEFQAEGREVELARVLVGVNLAPSMREARRVIEQGGVSVDGEKAGNVKATLNVAERPEVLLKVGKHRFLKVVFRVSSLPQRHGDTED